MASSILEHDKAIQETLAAIVKSNRSMKVLQLAASGPFTPSRRVKTSQWKVLRPWQLDDLTLQNWSGPDIVSFLVEIRKKASVRLPKKIRVPGAFVLRTCLGSNDLELDLAWDQEKSADHWRSALQKLPVSLTKMSVPLKVKDLALGALCDAMLRPENQATEFRVYSGHKMNDDESNDPDVDVELIIRAVNKHEACKYRRLGIQMVRSIGSWLQGVEVPEVRFELFQMAFRLETQKVRNFNSSKTSTTCDEGKRIEWKIFEDGHGSTRNVSLDHLDEVLLELLLEEEGGEEA